MQDGSDIQKAIAEHGNNPYILCIGEMTEVYIQMFQLILLTGEDICHVEQYLVVVEKTIVADLSSLWKAITIVITWYYIVDIVYPSECLNMLLFVEKALLNLPLSTKLSNSALQTISSIDHLQTDNGELENDI